MKGGRKNLKRASEEKHVTLGDGQCIMQVVSLRGSNLIEVMDASGEKSLALFPAKFQKSMWIKRGNFVVVDDSGKKEALESGSKVGCIVSQVLFYDQLRALKKSAQWPEIFKEDLIERATAQHENETDTSDDDDDGLPPLEANTNRMRPFEVEEDSESDSESDDHFVGSHSSTKTLCIECPTATSVKLVLVPTRQTTGYAGLLHPSSNLNQGGSHPNPSASDINGLQHHYGTPYPQ